MPSALNTFFPHSSGVPKLKAIIFAEFDSNKGPVITFQVWLFLNIHASFSYLLAFSIHIKIQLFFR